MKAECLGISHRKSSFNLHSRANKYSKHRTTSDGITHSPRGTGWEEDVRGPQLMLRCSAEGKQYNVNILSEFKYELGNVTEKRLEALENTMPRNLTAIENETQKGETYISLDKKELSDWLNNAYKQSKKRN